jgi:hypothetical protein
MDAGSVCSRFILLPYHSFLYTIEVIKGIGKRQTRKNSGRG